jgi:hydrogenase maturation protease
MTGPGAAEAGRPGPKADGHGRVAVIGVGNEFRRDDGIGPAVVAWLRGRVPGTVDLLVSDGDPARLIEAWSGADLAVVVDAVRASPAVPGRLHRLILGEGNPAEPCPVSSHGLGLGEAVGLAQALGRLPGRLIVHAVEAADLSTGTGLSPAVAAAADALAAAVLADVSAWT